MTPVTGEKKQEDTPKEVPKEEPESIEQEPQPEPEPRQIPQEPEQVEQSEEQENVPENAEHFKALLSFYKDEGLVDFEDDAFDGTKEKFAEILRQQRVKEQEMIQNSIIEAMPEEAQTIVEYILTEGADLTPSKLKSFLDVAEQSNTVPEIKDDSSAKAYLLEKYAKLHGDQTIAEKFVETLEDDGKLLDRAKTELDKDKEEAKKLAEAKIAESKQSKAQREQAQRQFQENLTKELQNTGWKPEVQQAVYNEIFSGNLKEKTSSIVNYPKALAKLTNYMRYFDPKTGDIDEEAFAKIAYSNAARNLKDTIDRHFSQSGAFGGGTVKTKKKNDNNVQYEFVD